MCAWRGQDNLHESVLSFCLMGPRDQTDCEACSKCLYLLGTLLVLSPLFSEHLL